MKVCVWVESTNIWLKWWHETEREENNIVDWVWFDDLSIFTMSVIQNIKEKQKYVFFSISLIYFDTNKQIGIKCVLFFFFVRLSVSVLFSIWFSAQKFTYQLGLNANGILRFAVEFFFFKVNKKKMRTIKFDRERGIEQLPTGLYLRRKKWLFCTSLFVSFL